MENTSILDCMEDCGLVLTDDKTAFLLYNLILQGCILPLIGIFGLFGNITAFFVFTRKKMRASLSCYLAALAISDCVLISGSVFMFTSDAMKHHQRAFLHLYNALVEKVYPLTTIAQTSSVYFTVSATIDCFLKACERKMRCARRLNFSRIPTALRTIFFVVIFAVSYNVPKFLEFRVLPCYDYSMNITTRQACATPIRRDPIYQEVYIIYMYPAIMVVGPIVILSLLTAYIIWDLFDARAAARRANGRLTSEGDSPIAMVSVVLLFLFCNILSMLINFLESSMGHLDIFHYFVDCSNALVVVNSSANILIYLSCDPKFKRTFLKQLCHRSTVEAPDKSQTQIPLLTVNGESTHGDMCGRNGSTYGCNQRLSKNTLSPIFFDQEEISV